MKKIFIVDDDDLILKSLVRSLKQPDVEVISFSAAEEVLPRLHEAPDLLICDYHLPRCSGLAVAKKAKLISPRIRTMLLSGGVEDERVTEALESKVVDRFLTKPWHHEELLTITWSLLRDPTPSVEEAALEGY